MTRILPTCCLGQAILDPKKLDQRHGETVCSKSKNSAREKNTHNNGMIECFYCIYIYLCIYIQYIYINVNYVLYMHDLTLFLLLLNSWYDLKFHLNLSRLAGIIWPVDRGNHPPDLLVRILGNLGEEQFVEPSKGNLTWKNQVHSSDSSASFFNQLLLFHFVDDLEVEQQTTLSFTWNLRTGTFSGRRCSGGNHSLFPSEGHCGWNLRAKPAKPTYSNETTKKIDAPKMCFATSIFSSKNTIFFGLEVTPLHIERQNNI